MSLLATAAAVRSSWGRSSSSSSSNARGMLLSAMRQARLTPAPLAARSIVHLASASTVAPSFSAIAAAAAAVAAMPFSSASSSAAAIAAGVPVTSRASVRVGQMVHVVQKSDQRSGRLTSGTVAQLLTNSEWHPRGIKVRLMDGTVGRVHAISNTASSSSRAAPRTAANAQPSSFTSSLTSSTRSLTRGTFDSAATSPSSSSSSSSFPSAPSLAAPASSSLRSSRSRAPRRSFHSVAARGFHRSAPVWHGSTAIPGGKEVHVTFVTPDGERVSVTGIEGENLLELAHANGVELEGACEASLACSTCHVILPDAYYAKLDPPVDEENDMLDLAFGLTDTSRLGCQVKLTTELEGMDITLPAATRNMAVDGFKPKPH